MYSEQDTAKSCPRAVGCPIRRSRDQRSLASPPGFSQRATSFIASQCQGIHQMPFIRASHATPNGKNHCETRRSPDEVRGSRRANSAPAKAGAHATGRLSAHLSRCACRRGETSFAGANSPFRRHLSGPTTHRPKRPSPKGHRPKRPQRGQSRLGHTIRFFTICHQQRTRHPMIRDSPGENCFMPRPRAANPPFGERDPCASRCSPMQTPVEGPLWRKRPVVEVNGIEPMTSCLQSRRSPG